MSFICPITRHGWEIDDHHDNLQLLLLSPRTRSLHHSNPQDGKPNPYVRSTALYRQTMIICNFIWVGLSECPFYIPPALPELWGSTAKISVKEPIISLALNNPRVLGSINIKTALENVKTWKLFMLQSIFLFLMICWTFGSWCRVQIFKRQNSVNLWKYRYRCYIC